MSVTAGAGILAVALVVAVSALVSQRAWDFWANTFRGVRHGVRRAVRGPQAAGSSPPPTGVSVVGQRRPRKAPSPRPHPAPSSPSRPPSQLVTVDPGTTSGTGRRGRGRTAPFIDATRTTTVHVHPPGTTGTSPGTTPGRPPGPVSKTGPKPSPKTTPKTGTTGPGTPPEPPAPRSPGEPVTTDTTRSPQGTDTIPAHMRAGTGHALSIAELADAADAHATALEQHATDAENLGVTGAVLAEWIDKAAELRQAAALIRGCADTVQAAATFETQQLTPAVETAQSTQSLQDRVTLGALRD